MGAWQVGTANIVINLCSNHAGLGLTYFTSQGTITMLALHTTEELKVSGQCTISEKGTSSDVIML